MVTVPSFVHVYIYKYFEKGLACNNDIISSHLNISTAIFDLHFLELPSFFFERNLKKKKKFLFSTLFCMSKGPIFILVTAMTLSTVPNTRSSLINVSWQHEQISLVLQFSSVAQSCPTLCDPMNCSMPGLPVHYQLLESTQTHAHWVGDAIQPSHPLSFPSPPAPNPSQHQGLFQWVSSLHEVAKVVEFRLQHQSFQWTPRTDLL